MLASPLLMSASPLTGVQWDYFWNQFIKTLAGANAIGFIIFALFFCIGLFHFVIRVWF